jgi:hypothetical protein
MNTMTPVEQIEALTAKCALLSASLRQSDETTKKLANIAADCSSLYWSHSNWQFALLTAIKRIAEDKHDKGEPLDVFSRDVVKHLAAIGSYLADSAVSASEVFGDDAKKVRS